MSVALNHTIIWCADKYRAAAFLTDILGLPPARAFMHFLVVDLDNDVSVDFYEKEGPVAGQHYAFLVDDGTFDATLARILADGIEHWADPARTRPREINTHYGGRGVYFADPDGHLLEIITTPYGEGPPD
jgi:catechol 2,3-dioxygenase-like lactoylglutathione lyase family enzyme